MKTAHKMDKKELKTVHNLYSYLNKSKHNLWRRKIIRIHSRGTSSTPSWPSVTSSLMSSTTTPSFLGTLKSVRLFPSFLDDFPLLTSHIPSIGTFRKAVSSLLLGWPQIRSILVKNQLKTFSFGLLLTNCIANQAWNM